MTERAVHWHEGMFLRPHHFQAAQRHLTHLGGRSEKWDLHYNWGLRDIDLDLDALANYRLVVRSLKARLRDGTLVAVPEDGLLPTLELQPAFEGQSALTVYLAVPVLRVGRKNASDNGRAEGARYLIDTQDLEDENTGLNPQPLQVRLLNLNLLLENQDRTGYEILPIARVEKSARAEATPQLDENYIPPVLGCDGWKPLANGILQNIYDQIGKRVEQFASQVTSRGIGFDSPSAGDRLTFEQLRVLNEAYALLGVQAFAEGVHPLPAYLELCRLVGQLSIFGPERRPPDLPHYDHDDLGKCFYTVKRLIQALLETGPKLEYKDRPFKGAGLRMQVALEPVWLESINQMFVGVQSKLKADDCVRLMTRPGELDTKIGSADRVDNIFKYAMPGLRFAHAPYPPKALPQTPGLVYFQIDRGSQKDEWQSVQKELSLAVRFNEKRLVGNIQGQELVTVTYGGQNVTLQLTLFVVPQERQPA